MSSTDTATIFARIAEIEARGRILAADHRFAASVGVETVPAAYSGWTARLNGTAVARDIKVRRDAVLDGLLAAAKAA